ncbi:Uncharacterised protein [uncultured Clostridium sp.]|uniref:hypothetical protein n=1 Tax=uncultured Clostridium sp. TaxID=59620 RepID=UPI000822D24E|nr:hypothetical protein [uncultured Clostridium sp.]SCJ00095.1 Uncharacterised protein [uncultured Clostridium sp.]
MINENNEIIITTSEAVEVLRVIDKLNMKKDLFEAIKKYFELNQAREDKLNKLRELIIDKVGLAEYEELSSTDKEITTKKVLIENTEFKDEFEKSMINYNVDLSTLAVDLTYTFASKIPNAEKEVYKCLAKISGKNVKEVEQQEFDKTVDLIMAIGKSKTFLGFSKLLNR